MLMLVLNSVIGQIEFMIVLTFVMVTGGLMTFVVAFVAFAGLLGSLAVATMAFMVTFVVLFLFQLVFDVSQLAVEVKGILPEVAVLNMTLETVRPTMVRPRPPSRVGVTLRPRFVAITD